MVRIGLRGLPEPDALRAIERAFAEISDVHDRMSFHEPSSELSFVNGNAHLRPVRVSESLRAVLEFAREISLATEGLFDVTIAPELVATGLLPRRYEDRSPQGNWLDIEIDADGCVFFRRPLCIDLGGIAKGYAVDRAVAVLREAGASEAVVNAGGDIGVLGSDTEQVLLRVDGAAIGEALPVIELSEGSLASSSTVHQRGSHLDGRSRTLVTGSAFAAVAAPRCMAADALTKVVLAGGVEHEALLHRFEAQAFLHRPDRGWSRFA